MTEQAICDAAAEKLMDAANLRAKRIERAKEAAAELERAETALNTHHYESVAKSMDLMGRCAAAEIELRRANAEVRKDVETQR